MVVNYNGGSLLGRCLRVLLSELNVERVWVADNASTDGSQAIIENLASTEAKLSAQLFKQNRGLSWALNRLAEQSAEADWLLLANPDAWPEPGALDLMLEAANSHAHVGLVGAWVVDEQGHELRGTRRLLPTPWRAAMTFSGLERFASRWPLLRGVNAINSQPPEQAVEVEAVSGAFLLVRGDLFRQLGGMDEGYFLHCEDLDLFLRVQRSGYRVVLEPTARVVHRQGTPSASAPRRVIWHKHRSMVRYLHQHAATFAQRVLALALTPVVYLRGIWKALWAR
jgi:hypothetical protein